MIREIELKQIERKYESFRLKDKNREKYLLSSIREYGVKEPLACSLVYEDKYVLLDGYKRLRCLVALKTSRIPITLVGTDEADSILHLIRLSNEKTLNILEQAIFVNELKKQFGLSITSTSIHTFKLIEGEKRKRVWLASDKEKVLEMWLKKNTTKRLRDNTSIVSTEEREAIEVQIRDPQVYERVVTEVA